MKRISIEKRLADAKEKYPKKVEALKKKGKWSAEQNEWAIKAGRLEK